MAIVPLPPARGANLYEESSEERANAPERECLECWREAKRYQDAITGADPRATAKLIEGLKRTQ